MINNIDKEYKLNSNITQCLIYSLTKQILYYLYNIYKKKKNQ